MKKIILGWIAVMIVIGIHYAMYLIFGRVGIALPIATVVVTGMLYNIGDLTLSFYNGVERKGR